MKLAILILCMFFVLPVVAQVAPLPPEQHKALAKYGSDKFACEAEAHKAQQTAVKSPGDIKSWHVTYNACMALRGYVIAK
jgi:hypothetical protein